MAKEKFDTKKKHKEKPLAEKYNEILQNKKNFKVTPDKINKVAPMWFVSMMCVTFYFGQFYLTPVVNESYKLSGITQCVLYGVLYWAFVQMVINWYCIRNVETMYKSTTNAVKPNAKHKATEDQQDVKASNDATLNGCDREQKNKPQNNENEQSTNKQDSIKSLVYKRYKVDGQIYAVQMPPVGSKTVQPVMYTYWSWKPCLKCEQNIPPRAHHCPLCKVCILKRDHHCYFSGRCIGSNNQRHFIVFSFYNAFASFLLLIYYVFYTYLMIYQYGRLSWFDIFLPATFLRWCFGYTAFHQVILYLMAYNLCFCMTMTARYVFFNMVFIKKGITSFEYDCNIKIKNVNSFYREMTAVFGKHCYLNLIFPCHATFPCQQDPVDWPNIKL